jgi:hypothetical protein
VKTTIEIPDLLFRKAKAAAVARGQTFKQLVTDALRNDLAKAESQGEPGWMKCFGSLKGHPEITRRIDAYIEENFERIDPELWK